MEASASADAIGNKRKEKRAAEHAEMEAAGVEFAVAMWRVPSSES